MFLLMRRATVRRAVGVELFPAITGLISRRLSPNSLFVARDTGALISASVSKLAAVPKPDWASTDVLVSLEESVPFSTSDTTSPWGSEGSELTFVVGCESGPSSSAGVLVAVPKVKGCPAATGTLHGATLGRVHLGMSRAAARHAFVKSSDRGKRYEDFFCLTPIGMRVGYASRKESWKLAGRVIWVSTSSAFYAVHRIRVGATVAAARTALKLTAPIRVGLNTWYFAANGKSNAIFKVRRGIIEEIGIAQKSLTGSARAQKAFLRSFR